MSNTMGIKTVITVLGLMLALSTQAFADAVNRIDVPAGDLLAAIEVIEKQASVEIVYQPEKLKGLKTAGVSGNLTAHEAVQKLLDGTQLKLSTDTATGAMLITAPQSATLSGDGQEATQMTLAQSTRTSTTDTEIANTAESSKSRDSADEDPKIQEVIVTAQKRSERLQDVPISISVLSGKDLDRSNEQGVSETLSRVPGVATLVSSQGGGTLLAIRGVTAGGPNFFGPSPAAFYVDSVPFGLVKSAFAPDANSFDLERIEVLRGPQGTLYGASAMSGVVRILTHDAQLDPFAFKARTSVSTTKDGGQNYRGDVAVNVPIVPGKLAARAVLGYQDLDGWIDHPNRKDANDAEIGNLRLKVNAQPTEQLSIGLSSWLSRADYGAPSISNDAGTNADVLDESMGTDFDVHGLKIGYDFAAATLTSVTSYLDFAIDSGLDLAQQGLPGSRLTTDFESNVFTQEFGLNSRAGGSWRWTLGGIYRDGEDLTSQFRPQYVQPASWTEGSQSFAVFGELTRMFADGRLELTGGLRYFEDEVALKEHGRSTGVTAAQPLVDSTRKFDAVSPRVILNWHPTQQMTVYASYAEGFRSGFDQNPAVKAAAPTLPEVDPDTLTNYEIGTKGTLWEGRLNFETALYYIDWQDIQLPVTVRILGTNFGGVVNSTAASGLGVDFAITGQPTEGLELGINFGWNDLNLDADVFTVSSTGVPVLLFAAGERPSYSPEYTAGVTADYRFPLGSNDLQGRFGASINFTSERQERSLSGTVVGVRSGDDLTVGRTSFSIESPRGWTGTLFIDNINDERGAVYRQTVVDWSVRIRPRTMGAQLEFSF